MEITFDFAFTFTLCLQESIEAVDVCAQDNTQKYLNRKDVQTALHAQLVGIKEWSLCSRQWYELFLKKNLEISAIFNLSFEVFFFENNLIYHKYLKYYETKLIATMLE